MTRQPRPDLLAAVIIAHPTPDLRTVAVALELERRRLVRWSHWRYRARRVL